MLRDLEGNIRKLLAAKKKEHDQLVYRHKQLQAEHDRLKLDMKDVSIDKGALGMQGEGDDPDRLRVVKEVFTRPFYTTDQVRVTSCTL